MPEQRPEEKNKANVRRHVDEALNHGDLRIVDESRGWFAEGSKKRILELRGAFPDLFTTIHAVIAEGDWVAHRMIHTGTHLGEFRGNAPTGCRVEFTSIVMNRFEGGVVVENWGLHDVPTLLEQLRSGQPGAAHAKNTSVP